VALSVHEASALETLVHADVNVSGPEPHGLLHAES
jgi:hypothetical protein